MVTNKISLHPPVCSKAFQLSTEIMTTSMKSLTKSPLSGTSLVSRRLTATLWLRMAQAKQQFSSRDCPKASKCGWQSSPTKSSRKAAKQIKCFTQMNYKHTPRDSTWKKCIFTTASTPTQALKSPFRKKSSGTLLLQLTSTLYGLWFQTCEWSRPKTRSRFYVMSAKPAHKPTSQPSNRPAQA